MENLINSLVNSVSDFNWFIAAGVMLAYFVIDAMYAYYTLSVARLNALAAANIGALMYFLVALGVLSYVENYLYILPIAIGSWFGTFYIIKKEKANKKHGK